MVLPREWPGSEPDPAPGLQHRLEHERRSLGWHGIWVQVAGGPPEEALAVSAMLAAAEISSEIVEADLDDHRVVVRADQHDDAVQLLGSDADVAPAVRNVTRELGAPTPEEIARANACTGTRPLLFPLVLQSSMRAASCEAAAGWAVALTVSSWWGRTDWRMAAGAGVMALAAGTVARVWHASPARERV